MNGSDTMVRTRVWGSLLVAASVQLGCATEVDPRPPAETIGISAAGAGGAMLDTSVVGAGSPASGADGTDLGTAGAGGTAGAAVAPDAPTTVSAGSESDPLVPVESPIAQTTTIDAFVCPGGHIVPGFNSLMVQGRARTFMADFPSDPGARMGILFSFHGYNQADGEHRTASNLDPNGDPAHPLVVITPDDLDFELPIGLDWQLDEGSAAKNVDLQMFEAIVGCLNEQYDVDPARIHALGFSAGSVMTSLLHSVYPKIVSSIVCISGMWFNDQAQIDQILFAGLVLKPTWPALRPEDAGTVLLTHGGLTDIAALIINLEAMAQAAFPFLAEGGRTVIDCPHTRGHTGHPDVGPQVISKFLSENPADQPSPYLSGGYAGFPSSCTLRLP